MIRAGSEEPDLIQAVGYTSAVVAALRSANRGNANNRWNVNTSGNVNNNNAYNAYSGSPDCVTRVIRLVHSISTPKEEEMQGAECLARRQNKTVGMRPSRKRDAVRYYSME